jgi:fermentation-respiration switch protein FrsA (DUF1100 family)
MTPNTNPSNNRRHPSTRTRMLRLGGVFLAASLAGVAFELMALSFHAARQVVFPARSTSERTPASLGLPYETVAFPSRDGLTMRGWFVPGGAATVVLTHGHASNKSDMLDNAAFLHQQGGYSVLLFDFRASGESDGDRATLGYEEWRDVAGALDYLDQRPGVDRGRIGALGVSMGAATLLMLGDEAKRLRGVVADSAFSDGESLVGRLDRWFNLPRWPFSLTVPWAVQYYSGLAPRDVAPVQRVASLAPIPLLIIHGELDHGIPAEDAAAIYAAAGEPKALWVAPGAGHGMAFSTAPDEYVQRVLAFFRQAFA